VTPSFASYIINFQPVLFTDYCIPSITEFEGFVCVLCGNGKGSKIIQQKPCTPSVWNYCYYSKYCTSVFPHPFVAVCIHMQKDGTIQRRNKDAFYQSENFVCTQVHCMQNWLTVEKISSGEKNSRKCPIDCYYLLKNF